MLRLFRFCARIPRLSGSTDYPLKPLAIIFIAFFFVYADSYAGELEEGLRAARAGDFDIAFKKWKPLADEGNANAQFNLGKMYASGKGVPKDYIAAVKWWKMAAEQGHAGAQFLVGVYYEAGKGVSKDIAEAVKWYQKTTNQGLAGAQLQLGLLYIAGAGVKKDLSKAVVWVRKAQSEYGEDIIWA